MKFFAKQKVDSVGITAVTLQKILVFLMILSLFTVFNGGLFSFLLCLIGFLGAYKRNTGMLTAYVTISVVLIVLCFFVALSSMFMMSSDDYAYDYSSSSAPYSYSSSSSDAFTPEKSHSTFARLHRAVSRYLAPGERDSTSSDSSVSSESSESSDSFIPYPADSNASYEDDYVTGIIFLSVVVLILGFFLAYLKVYSLVLAWRLRKMIFAAATALPTSDPEPQTHEFAPANTSCAVPDTELPHAPVSPFQPAPVFAPGFAPYPYSSMPMMPPYMQQFQGQFPPHHVMFGQQPVFYTYAPMNQQASEGDEKM